jgi:transposase InsO family protein
VTEIYPVAQSIVESDTASEREVCEFLNFARSPFQRWKQFELSPLEEEDKTVLPLIVKSFHAHRRRYGSRRIMDDLRDQGFSLGRRRVAKLMKIAGVSAIQPKSYKPRTTESKHTLGYNENLIMNLSNLKALNRLWVGDITYIPIELIKFGYLAVLMDRFSRKIVGWKLGTDMTEQIVIASLKTAIKNRKPAPGMIHHTDRGGQYAGKEYRKIIKRADMRQSMSRAGDCYDNAFMESCFGTIKNELEMTEYKNYNQALKDIREYISYYNFERKHSAIEYQTPSQFEQNFNLN